MEDEILFEEKGTIGLITLNRPKALNSLTQNMCALVRVQLEKWRLTPSVKAVVVVGSGEKAFCAGGDVVKVSSSYQAGSDEWRGFFYDEYLMNIAISEFPKPYISFVDGIVMGGGVGISIPGDFWVATEKTLFAMPETGLGLFPDVGGGWFLPRLPGEAGMYLALTGARLKTPDLYALGIASHTVLSVNVPLIIEALAEASIASNNDVADILDTFHSDPEPAPLSPYFEDIDDHFDHASVEAVVASLEADNREWAQKQAGIIATKSPTSLKVTFAQLQRGAALETFRENMAMEYRVVNHMMAHPDFHEGVRALLIDKDNSPKWSPATLDAVKDSEVESFFESLGRLDLLAK
ncbi:enoyl-CoA hydratase/isomerase family protein [Kordiimonas pumila]|uniref:3-hydroxyisobutyryl-CoA hydrolase n=1 Tax=Kordiimonas pumila TaxID=2161677 RepID=A0ABV7D3I9_9PROT|nr:enoyl-CoA hydratase/isomerase family protein [Kordiimonas pumila]